MINKRSAFAHKFVLMAVAFLMLPLFFVTRNVVVGFSSSHQDKEKRIERLSYDNEPVEISKLKANDNVLELGKKIPDTDDWLKHFKIEFKNKSDKIIVYLCYDLDFPETKETGNIFAFPLCYGINPFVNKNNDNKQLLEPGDVAEVQLTDAKLATLKEIIERRQPFSGISKINIRLSFIAFEDGTAWSGGSMLRPDPNKTNRFIPITSSLEKEQQQ